MLTLVGLLGGLGSSSLDGLGDVVDASLELGSRSSGNDW